MRWGFYYSLSDDLVHWSAPIRIMDTRAWGDVGELRLYPSLLDPASSSRNFETTGRSPWLYFTRFHGGFGSLDRDLVRVRIALP